MRLAFAVTFLYVSMLADPAEAYLDPGAGSILVQLLLGGAAGAAVLLKLYWQRIRGLFSRAEPETVRPTNRPR